MKPEEPTRRLAAFYDIHGNLSALEAVIEDALAARVDRIVVGGDIVPGPMPAAAVDTLLDLPVPVDFIQGNGERDVLAIHRGEQPARVPPAFHDSLQWVESRLSDEHLTAFGRWPLTRILEIEGLGEVLFCHATPRDDNEIFTRATPEQALRPIFAELDVALVVCGHTHMQFDRRIANVRVVNAGSVGMPFGEPGAYWVLLGHEVELRRSQLDLAAAAARVRATDYPLAEEFARHSVLEPPSEGDMLEVFRQSEAAGSS